MITYNKKEFTADIFVSLVQCDIIGDPKRVFSCISSLENIKENSIIYIENNKYIDQALLSNASVIIIKEKTTNVINCNKTFIIFDNPKLLFSIATGLFKKREVKPGFFGKNLIIQSDIDVSLCEIGNNITIGYNVSIENYVVIGDNCVIADNVSIGQGTYLFPGVILYDNVKIGNNCIIHANAVIGADGFGYVFDGKIHNKIEHLGSVIIGNNVEIGANTCIDRGTINNTIIGDGVKIDNLVQIAHNVVIGDGTLIASQTGIAGGAVIGKNVMIAGQVGIADHAVVEDNVFCSAQSGLTRKTFKSNMSLLGTPAIDSNDYKKIYLSQLRLPDLVKKVNLLEKMISDMDKKNK